MGVRLLMEFCWVGVGDGVKVEVLDGEVLKYSRVGVVG